MTKFSQSDLINQYPTMLNVAGDVGHRVIHNAFNDCLGSADLKAIALEDVDGEGLHTVAFHSPKTVVMFEYWDGRARMKMFEPAETAKCRRNHIWHAMLGTCDLRFETYTRYEGYTMLNRLLDDDDFSAHKLFQENGGTYVQKERHSRTRTSSRNTRGDEEVGVSKKASVARKAKRLGRSTRGPRITMCAPVDVIVCAVDENGKQVELHGGYGVTLNAGHFKAHRKLFLVIKSTTLNANNQQVEFPKFELQLGDRISVNLRPDAMLAKGDKLFRSDVDRVQELGGVLQTELNKYPEFSVKTPVNSKAAD